MATDLPFDPALVEGVRARDPDALAAVWRALCPPLIRWLCSQLGDLGLAEDVAQGTFLELVEGADRLPGDARGVRAWLYTAARHNLIDLRRKSARRPEVVTDTMPDRPADDRTDDQAEASEVARTVHAALEGLTPEQRQVLTLRFLGELSAPEVAVVMGISEGAVRALQRRGVAAMARLLAPSPVPIQAERALDAS